MNKKIISFSGKGGVGKSTLATLLLKFIVTKYSDLEVLVIDADPDSNIADLLDIEVDFNATVGGIATNFKQQISEGSLSPGVPKNQILEAEIFDSVIEMEKFDLMVMGRSEGEGCYCYINSILKAIIDSISKDYSMTILDMPAGLEHFARKTDKDVDELVIVTDPSKMGFHTMHRIIELTDELSLNFNKIWVIGNRFTDGLKPILEEEISKIKRKNINLLGIIPIDDEISDYNFLGKSILNLPTSNNAYIQYSQIIPKILE